MRFNLYEKKIVEGWKLSFIPFRDLKLIYFEVQRSQKRLERKIEKEWRERERERESEIICDHRL